MVYTLAEFSKLSCSAICRRYGYGHDEWLDSERNERAEHEVETATET
jgi:hypothetical protein